MERLLQVSLKYLFPAPLERLLPASVERIFPPAVFKERLLLAPSIAPDLIGTPADIYELDEEDPKNWLNFHPAVPWTHQLPTSPTHIPQLDGNLDLLIEPDYAPVPDPLCPRLLETCASHLASEPNEPEHFLAQEFVLRLCPKIIPVICDEFRKHARYKNVRQCMK